MIVVIFEVILYVDKKQVYFDMVVEMCLLVEEIDGFLLVECFQSLINLEKFFFVLFFRDEEVFNDWWWLIQYCKVQVVGCKSFFKDYWLWVVYVLWDYGMEDWVEVFVDSWEFYDKD